MERITQRAMAKINLGLDVVRRLANGYHQVKMVMQSVRIYDELRFEKTKEGICLETDHALLPTGGDNLAVKAARLIAKEHPFCGGVKITLKKKIPMAAGMAGGSADAAAVFHGLNSLFSLGMDREEMMRLGVRIGADVPFCIAGGTMLSEGIGEILTPLPAPPRAFLVIAKPAVDVSTAYVYGNLHVETLQDHPDIEAVIEGIRSGSLEKMCVRMENILEHVTAEKYPIIKEIKTIFNKCGASVSLMSGSGPSVFALFAQREWAEAAYGTLKESGLAPSLFLTEFADTGCESAPRRRQWRNGDERG